MNIIDIARECGAREAVDADDGAQLIEFTASALTALESRVRADEREKCAKEVPTTWLHPLLSGESSVMPRGGEAINGSHIEALLRGVAAAIRNSDGSVPVAE